MGNHILELGCASNASSKMTKCKLRGAQPSLPSWDKFHHMDENDSTFVLSNFFVLSVQFAYLCAEVFKIYLFLWKKKNQ